MGKPQRRTLVKVLRELVDRVNEDVFEASLNTGVVADRYRPLLRATNAAEVVLDRERQHARKEGDE